MAEESMARIELAEKHPVSDFLKDLGQYAPRRFMELEVGAVKHERSDDHAVHRKGRRDRACETRLGTMALRITKLRTGTYYHSFLKPRRMSEHAQVAGVQEVYVHRVGTRKVDDLVRALDMTGIANSQVSRLCGELDQRVEAFRNRPPSGDWPYRRLGASYVRSRDDGVVSSRAVVVSVAVNAEGRREVVGVDRGPTETDSLWT